jgi:hypothetical protein
MSNYIISISPEKLFLQVRAKLNFWMLNKAGMQTRQQLEDTLGYISFERFANTKSFRKFESAQVKDVLLLVLKLDVYSFELDESEEKFRLARNHPLRIVEDLE